jgi:hypothetical protein
MLTGMDCFGTQVVALRHKGPAPRQVPTLPEILRERGLQHHLRRLHRQPASRGFDKYIDLSRLGQLGTRAAAPRPRTSTTSPSPNWSGWPPARKPFFLFLRHMDPHSPYLPPAPFERMFYHGNELRPEQQVDGAGDGLQAVLRLLRQLDAAGHHRQGLRHRPVRRRGRLHGRLHPAIFTALEALRLLDDTIVVINGDHGETLYDHDCYFDHHGLYDDRCTCR